MSVWNDERPDMKPGDQAQETRDGHVFLITATNDTGCHTGRQRYMVQCESCNVLVHRGSTSASAQMECHLRYPGK